MGDRRRETTLYLVGLVVLSCLWTQLQPHQHAAAPCGGFYVDRGGRSSPAYQRRLREGLLVRVNRLVAAHGEPEALLAELNSCQVPPRFVLGHSLLVAALQHVDEGRRLTQRDLRQRARKEFRQADRDVRAGGEELRRQLQLARSDR